MVLKVSLVALVWWWWNDVLLPPSQVSAKQGQESAANLAPDANLDTASNASLQNTLRRLEQSHPGLTSAPEAEQAVRKRIDEIMQAMCALDPVHVQVAKLQSAIERAAKQLENKRQAVNAAMEQWRKAEEHLHGVAGQATSPLGVAVDGEGCT